MHGLRHSFRDRLGQAEAPMEVIDRLGSWSLRTVNQSHDNGHMLGTLPNGDEQSMRNDRLVSPECLFS